jgi:hypothetical protein
MFLVVGLSNIRKAGVVPRLSLSREVFFPFALWEFQVKP